MKEKIELRSRAKSLEPIVRLGKSGLSEGMVEEINKNLRKKKLIKIKLLAASFESQGKAKLVDSIVQATNSELIDAVGNVIVLHKK